jgi:hypothetical protein
VPVVSRTGLCLSTYLEHLEVRMNPDFTGLLVQARLDELRREAAQARAAGLMQGDSQLGWWSRFMRRGLVRNRGGRDGVARIAPGGSGAPPRSRSTSVGCQPQGHAGQDVCGPRT